MNYYNVQYSPINIDKIQRINTIKKNIKITGTRNLNNSNDNIIIGSKVFFYNKFNSTKTL
jgi:hypothetical protein